MGAANGSVCSGGKGFETLKELHDRQNYSNYSNCVFYNSEI